MENGKLRVKSTVFLIFAFSNSPKSILDALREEEAEISVYIYDNHIFVAAHQINIEQPPDG